MKHSSSYIIPVELSHSAKHEDGSFQGYTYTLLILIHWAISAGRAFSKGLLGESGGGQLGRQRCWRRRDRRERREEKREKAGRGGTGPGPLQQLFGFSKHWHQRTPLRSVCDFTSSFPTSHDSGLPTFARAPSLALKALPVLAQPTNSPKVTGNPLWEPQAMGSWDNAQLPVQTAVEQSQS